MNQEFVSTCGTYDCSDRLTERVSLKSESTSAAVPERETDVTVAN